MTTLFAIILFFAGLLPGLGALYFHGKLPRDVKVLLAFSGAYLLALAVLHLLPEIYIHLEYGAGLYILAGFIVQMIMDYFSRGIEHGHIHPHLSVKNPFPLGIYLSLFLHSIIEGLPLGGEFAHHHGGHEFKPESLLVGIAIHKIPEAVALAAILYHVFKVKKKVVFFILLYALATPLGIVLGSMVLKKFAEDPEHTYAAILAFTVGIFLHVSTTIIFEADESHRLSWRKALAIVAGIALVLLL
jgi:zinc transporter ZupT